MFAAIEPKRAARVSTNEPESRTVTIAEAARQLGVATSFLYRLVQRGDCPFPILRLGRRVVVSRQVLDRYLAGDGNHAA